MMFMFYWPWLILLLPLPLVARFFLPASKETELPAVYFPALHRLQISFSESKGETLPSNRLFLLTLSMLWLCLVLAVMRPQFVDEYTHVQHEGYDLMLAVDISGSMRALDFSTKEKILSRLDVTKEVVGKFISERQGDRIGLILFGENAFLRTPLTLDTLSVNHMLNDAVSGMAGLGTAIGDAIGLSIRSLRTRPEGSRILVLLTDGVDTASSIPPLEAAKIAKQYGIRIYTIGVGKKGPVPYPNDRGGIDILEVPMDEALLEELSTLTDGHYFRATDQHALEAIYDKINQLEKTKSNVRTYAIRKPLYQYPLGFAVVLLFSLYALGLYRRMTYGA
ncbi:MAG: VWA domain-containing protein [Alphaproteobacteria bacterium]|nr:VWA domain-containing protein [Alphaproteobacteria bacterium]